MTALLALVSTIIVFWVIVKLPRHIDYLQWRAELEEKGYSDRVEKCIVPSKELAPLNIVAVTPTAIAVPDTRRADMMALERLPANSQEYDDPALNYTPPSVYMALDYERDKVISMPGKRKRRKR